MAKLPASSSDFDPDPYGDNIYSYAYPVADPADDHPNAAQTHVYPYDYGESDRYPDCCTD